MTAPNTADAMKRYQAGKAGFTDIAHLKAKGKIKRSDGTKRKSAKYVKESCEAIIAEIELVLEEKSAKKSDPAACFFIHP